MKDLSCANKKEQEDFINSFDYVFCDVDGVLWNEQVTIPGAPKAIRFLKSLGKRIIYVSNNSTKTQNIYYNQLTSAGFDLEKSDLIRPPQVIINFLKKQNFIKEIYFIGMSHLKTELENAGFKICNFDYDNPEESTGKYFKGCLSVSDNVGAVIAAWDLNLTVAKLQMAATYLTNPEVIFITGGSEKQLKTANGDIIIGPGAFHEILADMAGRKPHVLGKPGLEVGNFIKEKFKIEDASRVLFVGDTIVQDMGFATACGYRKMLVLTGSTAEDSIRNWTFPERFKPEYYADSLDVINKVLNPEEK